MSASLRPPGRAAGICASGAATSSSKRRVELGARACVVGGGQLAFGEVGVELAQVVPVDGDIRFRPADFLGLAGTQKRPQQQDERQRGERRAEDPEGGHSSSFAARSRSAARQRRLRRTPAAQAAHQHHQAGQQQRERPDPERRRAGLERRPVEHEVAVARHHELAHFTLARALGELLAHLVAQVDGERRIGVGERLVLAHQAAQLVGQRGDALVENRILRGADPAE